MTERAPGPRVTTIPILRYQDAVKAIDWLCEALGFEKKLVVPDGSGGIRHAQLSLGNGLLMLGSVRKEEQPSFVPPMSLGGAMTQATTLIVTEPDSHYARARAAGAEILVGIADWPQGGRGFSCRDPEGHIWHVGSYDPFA